MIKKLLAVLSLLILLYAVIHNLMFYDRIVTTYIIRSPPMEDDEIYNETIDDSDREFFSTIQHPVIVWWTSFTNDRGTLTDCGENKCFFSIKRKFRHHPKLMAYLFYGTHFKLEDLPLPKQQDWGLFHEESPKNNFYLFSNEEVMRMFNHTSTFKKESDMPLTTLHLHSLDAITSTQFFKATAIKNKMLADGKISLAAYVHSDCDVPSDRDNLMTIIQTYMKVDSYGKCLHNKDLPENLANPMDMSNDDFFEILSHYKFMFAFENALCDDYTTEKYWRAIEIGVVPIVLGSNRIKDLMPHDKAAILVRDYETAEELVNYILYLNDNDDEYEKFLIHKTQSKITNVELIESVNNRLWYNHKSGYSNYSSEFQCMVCNRIHEKINKKQDLTYIANASHYGCPRPTQFSNKPFGNLTMVPSNSWWAREFDNNERMAKAFENLLSLNRSLTHNEIFSKSHDYY